MRRGDLEFRQLENRDAEIVHWKEDSLGNNFCYTLMFFEKNNEGFHANFVLDRPLQYENFSALWSLMRYAQKILNAKFELDNHDTI